MQALLSRVIVAEALLVFLLTTTGCGKNNKNDAEDQQPLFAGPGPGSAGRPIRGIMTKIGKGPRSLHESLGGELKADPPSWETIHPQAKEYAQLAGSLGKLEPPKGSKELWVKSTDSFHESAAALERAAEAKDKKAALAAHVQLTESCKSCHREHRGGPGGPPGGPGRPPGPPQPAQGN
jgi:Cytochrome C'